MLQKRLFCAFLFLSSAAPLESWGRPPSGLPVSDSPRLGQPNKPKQAQPPSQAASANPPANDACANRNAISGLGEFPFDNSTATTDGPVHLSCGTLGGDEQITNDLWYCWTATCTKQVLARTCGSTQVDTKIAVYEGCTCPTTDDNLLDCDDDRCAPFQSMAAFNAITGHQYLIRLGSYPGEPGGEGALTISCGPPNHASCPAAGDCCTSHPQPGACSDETCCETVCLCDPFCCDTEWDSACAGGGFAGSGCGAEALCPTICGPPCDPGNPCPDDGLECTQDLCVNAECTHPPRSLGTPCADDGDPCTRDTCNGSGLCVHTEVSCGACCHDDLACADDVLSGECHATGGYFYPSQECANISCASVPTVSEWGLIILVLLAFVAARYVFGRSAQQDGS